MPLKETTFSKNLIQARKKRGWTQEVASDIIGISRSLLGAYEEARCDPPHTTLTAIANAYGIYDLYAFINNPDIFEKEQIFHDKLKAPTIVHIQSEIEKRYNSLKPKEKKIANILLGISQTI